MQIVLDTNILIASVRKISPHRIIFDSFLKKKFALLLSNDVLFEYEEIFTLKGTPDIALLLLDLFLAASNSEFHQVYYK